MEDSRKLIVIAVILGLVALLFCKSNKAEKMMPISSQGMPVAVTPMAQTGALMPADHDTTDYGPYPGASKPCATAIPYA